MGDAGFAAMMRGSMTLSLELPPKAAAEFDDCEWVAPFVVLCCVVLFSVVAFCCFC